MQRVRVKYRETPSLRLCGERILSCFSSGPKQNRVAGRRFISAPQEMTSLFGWLRASEPEGNHPAAPLETQRQQRGIFSAAETQTHTLRTVDFTIKRSFISYLVENDPWLVDSGVLQWGESCQSLKNSHCVPGCEGILNEAFRNLKPCLFSSFHTYFKPIYIHVLHDLFCLHIPPCFTIKDNLRLYIFNSVFIQTGVKDWQTSQRQF